MSVPTSWKVVLRVIGYRLPRVHFAVAGEGPEHNQPDKQDNRIDAQFKRADSKHEKKHEFRYEAPGWLTAAVILVIAFVWAATYLAQIFNPLYHPNSGINTVFLIVLATLIGRPIVKGLFRD